MKKEIRFTLILSFCLIAFSLIIPTYVQSGEGSAYPVKPIRIILFTAPGSSVDFIVRGTAPYLEKYLGVRLILDNRVGGDGAIAWNTLYKAKPDGYTYGVTALPPFLMAPVQKKVKWRAEEFSPVFAWAIDNNILFVNAETWKTFDEFVKVSKEKTLTLGLTGYGTSAGYLASVLMVNSLKLNIRFVGFDGSGETLAALAGKHIDCGISMPQTAIGLVKGGRIRPILSFASDADPVFPDVPTPKSLGYDIKPLSHIKALAGPPGTPKERVAVFESAFKKILKDPECQEWARQKNVNLISMTSEQMGEEIRRENEILAKLEHLLVQPPK